MNFVNKLKDPIYRGRFLVMLASQLLLALGSAFFNESQMGMHPFSSFGMAISVHTGISFGTISALESVLLFLVMLAWGRKYIGAGTFVNWLLLGYVISFWSRVIELLVPSHERFACRLVFVVIAVLFMALAVAIYQYVGMGISPYDASSMILTDKTPVSYFWCRFFTDAVMAILTFLAGGIIGLGTLLCVFGLSPFINFFDRFFCAKLLKKYKV